MFHVSKILISSNQLSFQQAGITIWWTAHGIQWKFFIRGCGGEETCPPNLGCVFSSCRKGRQEISAFSCVQLPDWKELCSECKVSRSCKVRTECLEGACLGVTFVCELFLHKGWGRLCSQCEANVTVLKNQLSAIIGLTLTVPLQYVELPQVAQLFLLVISPPPAFCTEPGLESAKLFGTSSFYSQKPNQPQWNCISIH